VQDPAGAGLAAAGELRDGHPKDRAVVSRPNGLGGTGDKRRIPEVDGKAIRLGVLKSPLNTFGRDVPALIFGTWQLGGAYRFGGKPDGLGSMTASTAQDLLDRAYGSGIRVFDTADI